jgi:hypothetical protein
MRTRASRGHTLQDRMLGMAPAPANGRGSRGVEAGFRAAEKASSAAHARAHVEAACESAVGRMTFYKAVALGSHEVAVQRAL